MDRPLEKSGRELTLFAWVAIQLYENPISDVLGKIVDPAKSFEQRAADRDRCRSPLRLSQVTLEPFIDVPDLVVGQVGDTLGT